MRRLSASLLLLSLLGLGGCSQLQPYTYVNQREIPPGPGVFSGERGAFEWQAAPSPDAE